MRSQAELSRSLLASSGKLIEGSRLCQAEIRGGIDSRAPVEDTPARETESRQRLLEWEAEDLSQVVPGEMDRTRRQFAISLYETVRLAASLGMTEERWRYHLDYARERYQRGE